MTHPPHIHFFPHLILIPFQINLTALSCGSKLINFTFILLMTCFSSQVDFTSCGGLLCIAAVLLMIIGIVTAVVLSFQYVRTLWSNSLIYSLYSCFSVWAVAELSRVYLTYFTFRRLAYVTQQVPWLHMLYAAIGAIIYTLVSPHLHEFRESIWAFVLQGYCWITLYFGIPRNIQWFARPSNMLIICS